jgi:glycerophosphoryl diester phosphodiesterase
MKISKKNRLFQPKKLRFFVLLITVCSFSLTAQASDPRALFLVDQLPEGMLKEKLLSCQDLPQKRTNFSIGHRGAALMFPEHTEQSYKAAARMGAGIVECDVTFTKDKKLVCRHSQNDLHTTTNILTTDLAKKCTRPFEAVKNGSKANAECRTSDLMLSEYLSLNGKMDGADKNAKTAAAYVKGTANWRTDLYAATGGSLLTHAQSIQLLDKVDVNFTPELKSPAVSMPYDGMSQEDFAQKMIDDYKQAGIDPGRVWAQSFNLNDILYWIKKEPQFGRQAVYLDGRFQSGLNPSDPDSFSPSMEELKAMGVNYIAPPLWMLVTSENGKIVPSEYSKTAKAAGLKLITWTLERSGPLAAKKGGWYYKSIANLVKNDSATYQLLHALAQDVGVVGVFSDWPATVTYYANCFDLD